LRFLVLSDVHANLTALNACLEAADGRWERAVCLGDLVGYGPDPNEAIDRVRHLTSSVIRGNHDKAACGLETLDDFNPLARAAMEWTRAELRPDNVTYLKELPAGPLQVDGLTLVHGALHDEDEYVFAPLQALDSLLASPAPLIFFGHTHMQGGFSYRDDLVDLIQLRPAPGAAFSALRLEPGTRYLLNPGSVGQPRDSDPRAAFAIADLDHMVVEFWRVPYDIQAVQTRMFGAGTPEPLIARLGLGR
jgi:predicted phosphodiesterase